MKKIVFLLCVIGFSIAQAMNRREVPSLRDVALKNIAQRIADQVRISDGSDIDENIQYAQGEINTIIKAVYPYGEKDSESDYIIYPNASHKPEPDTVTPVLKGYLTQALGLKRFTLDTQFQAPFTPRTIAFNPHNNNQLVIQDEFYDKGIARCDASTGACAHFLIANQRKMGSSVAYTKSGLAIQVENSINLYDATRGAFIRPLVDNPEDPIKEFCYDSAHDRIIFTTQNNKIMATSSTGLEVLIEHYDSGGLSEGIFCSNQGNSLAIRHVGKLLLYDLATGTLKKVINAPGSGPVAYAPNDQIVAFPTIGLKIKLVNLVSDRVKTYTMPDIIQHIAYNPDTSVNELAASDDKNVYIIHPDSPVQNQKITIETEDTYRALPLAYNANGTLLAVGEQTRGLDTRIYRKDYYQSASIAEIIIKALDPVKFSTTGWIKEPEYQYNNSSFAGESFRNQHPIFENGQLMDLGYWP